MNNYYNTKIYLRLSLFLNIFIIFYLGLVTSNNSQPTNVEATNSFRSGIFLHHSTGECIWGPNGSSTSVPQEMTIYNTANGYIGANAVTLNEEWWPSGDNEWYVWHEIFDNVNPYDDITPYLQSNKIIIIKSCFPSSMVSGVGTPSDTLDPTIKTIYNYKWHWRNIIEVMELHEENFFAIWTNAPLVENETNPLEAQLSDRFCRWAKDTLANGYDPLYGTFPLNVYVFDFFHKLADANGILPQMYASGPYDSHPNAAATELVAPQFVNEIFDAAIDYESLVGINGNTHQIPADFSLEQNFPNPFNPGTRIKYSIPLDTRSKRQDVRLIVYDMLGRELETLVNEQKPAGTYEITWFAGELPNGIYFYRFQAGDFVETKQMVLIK